MYNDPDDWKKNQEQDLSKNDFDYERKVIVNTHTKIPWIVNQWKITEDEPMRVEAGFRNHIYCLVFDEQNGPRVEVYDTDEYGQLTELIHKQDILL